MFESTKDWIGKRLSKSVIKSQRLALSPSLSEPLAQVQKNFCKHNNRRDLGPQKEPQTTWVTKMYVRDSFGRLQWYSVDRYDIWKYCQWPSQPKLRYSILDFVNGFVFKIKIRWKNFVLSNFLWQRTQIDPVPIFMCVLIVFWNCNKRDYVLKIKSGNATDDR